MSLSSNFTSRSPLAAPRVGVPNTNTRGPQMNRPSKATDDDDDFGDTDVTSLLG